MDWDEDRKMAAYVRNRTPEDREAERRMLAAAYDQAQKPWYAPVNPYGSSS